jgi:hypothetical protein
VNSSRFSFENSPDLEKWRWETLAQDF